MTMNGFPMGKRKLQEIASSQNPKTTLIDGAPMAFAIVRHVPCGTEDPSEVVSFPSNLDQALREIERRKKEEDECGQQFFAAALHPSDLGHKVKKGEPFPFEDVVWADASEDPLS